MNKDYLYFIFVLTLLDKIHLLDHMNKFVYITGTKVRIMLKPENNASFHKWFDGLRSTSVDS